MMEGVRSRRDGDICRATGSRVNEPCRNKKKKKKKITVMTVKGASPHRGVGGHLVKYEDNHV